MRKQRGTIVSPDEPRRETGVYWGYTVRIAHSISEIFTKSPYPGGYDLTVGTSDRGSSIHEVPSKSFNYNHLLLVFGGLQGLEAAVANEDKLQVDDPKLLFDHYINVLPKQGSRTIRTEEAILIAMASLQEKFNPQVEDIEEELIKESLPRSEDTGGIIPKPSQTKMERKRKRQEENEKHPLVVKDESISQDVVLQPENGVEVKKPKEKKVKNNPFSSKKEAAVVDFTDNGVVGTSAADDDFEIVPVGKADKTTTEASVDDLSRFD